MEEYDIYLRSFDADDPRVPVLGLGRLFGLDTARARELIASVPRVVKRRVPGDQVERYAKVLREIGADVELRRSPILPQRVIAITSPAPDAGAVTVHEAEHGSTLMLPALPAGASHAPPSMDDTVVDKVPAWQRVVAGAQTWTETGAPRAPAMALPAEPAAQEARPTPEAASAPAVARWSSALDIPAPAALAAAPAPQAAPSGPPADPPAVSADGRPQWLIEDRQYRAEVLERVAGQTAVASVSGAIELPGAEPPEAPDAEPPEPPEPPGTAEARPSAKPVAPAGPPPVAPLPLAGQRPLPAHPALRPPPEAPPGLRVAVRVALACAVFLVAVTARSCRMFGDDVSDEVEAWALPAPEPQEPVASEAEPAGAPALGQASALAWSQLGLHQFSNGDKDRVRGLIRSLMAAGATDVHAGGITANGPMQIATELRVSLPQDAARRAAIYQVIRTYRASSWGVDPGDAQGDPFGGRDATVIELS